jgi:single-strand DNA-binding protein
MSQGGYVTLVGFVAREPNLRETKDGRHVTDVRVGTTARLLDKQTGVWRDGETSYYSVSCWRRLADHVKASLRKGDPVVVKGRFKTRSYEDKAGRFRTEVEIVADTVGHDLNRGVANYIRQQRPAVVATADPAADEETGAPDLGEDADMIDEEAIERFGRELDAGLDEAELTAGAFDEDETAPRSAATHGPGAAHGSVDDDESRVTVPAASPVPF